MNNLHHSLFTYDSENFLVFILSSQTSLRNFLCAVFTFSFLCLGTRNARKNISFVLDILFILNISANLTGHYRFGL